MDIKELERLEDIIINELDLVSRGCKPYGKDYVQIMNFAKMYIELLIRKIKWETEQK